MSEKDPNISDQILDLLLNALQERQRQRETETAPSEQPVLDAAEPKASIEEPEPVRQAEVRPSPPTAESVPAQVESESPMPEPEPPTVDEIDREQHPEAELSSSEPAASVDLGGMLRRLFLAMILLVILVNIPYDRFGKSLARAMPDSAALIIRDGLLLKGSGEEVYVVEDNKLRWITTLDAFQEYGYRWERVHMVEDEFLQEFEDGFPIHLLLKCQASPHIYALENGEKRWIEDIPTFEGQGYVWEDVRFVSCQYLRNLPDGKPIPEDAGPPPQP
jgi:hypothetical protein